MAKSKMLTTVVVGMDDESYYHGMGSREASPPAPATDVCRAGAPVGGTQYVISSQALITVDGENVPSAISNLDADRHSTLYIVIIITAMMAVLSRCPAAVSLPIDLLAATRTVGLDGRPRHHILVPCVLLSLGRA